MVVKKTLKKYVLPAIGVIILILFIRNIPSDLLSISLKEIGIINLLVLLSLTVFNLLLKALRWQLLIHKISSAKIPLQFSFTTVLAGIAGSSIMPGKVELARPLMLKTDYDVPLARSISALSIERVMDLVSLLAIMILSILFLSSSLNINFILPAMIGASAMLIVVAVVALFAPYWLSVFEKIIFMVVKKDRLKEKTRQFLHSFFEGLSKLEKTYLSVMTAFSVVINSIEIIRFYLLLQMLGVAASLAAIGFAFTASIIIGVVTMIPGGVGVTEISAAEIISNLLPAAPKGLITGGVLLDRVIAYYLLIALGALILTFSGRFQKMEKEAEKRPTRI